MKGNDFAGLVANILQRNRDVAFYLMQSPGGWEGWLQGQLAFELLQYHNVFANREFTDCYGGRDRADLYLESTQCVIEIKAWGLGRIGGKKSLLGTQANQDVINELAADFAKLEGIDNKYLKLMLVVIPSGKFQGTDTVLADFSKVKNIISSKKHTCMTSEQFEIYVIGA